MNQKKLFHIINLFLIFSFISGIFPEYMILNSQIDPITIDFSKFKQKNLPNLNFELDNLFSDGMLENKKIMKIDEENYFFGATIRSNNSSFTLNSQIYQFNGTSSIIIGDINIKTLHITNLTIWGGNGENYFTDSIRVGGNNRTLIVGYTSSTDFPITPNAFQKNLTGIINGFILELNHDKNLVFSSYIGGSRALYLKKIGINQNGDIIISGYTNSEDFPELYLGNDILKFGSFDAIICKFEVGNYEKQKFFRFGGNGFDSIVDMAIDAENNIIIAGTTSSNNLITTEKVFDKNYNGNLDGWILKINLNYEILFVSYLGDAKRDEIIAITIDLQSFIWIVGFTESKNFPTTTDAYQRFNKGNIETFITRIKSDGTKIISSTYLGGKNLDIPNGIFIEENYWICVYGKTQSNNFPQENIFLHESIGEAKGNYYTILNPLLTRIEYSSFS